MVKRKVHDGEVGVGCSCVPGRFILATQEYEPDGGVTQCRIILTRQEMEDLIERLKGMLG